jgi:hypothetical protein
VEGAQHAEPRFQNAVFEWEDGYRRLEAARSDPGRHRLLGRVVLAVEDELRKRLGSRFTVKELAGLYRDASDILLDVGMAALPPGTDLRDVSAAVDAAFYLYMREAADFGGGRPSRPGNA